MPSCTMHINLCYGRRSDSDIILQSIDTNPRMNRPDRAPVVHDHLAREHAGEYLLGMTLLALAVERPGMRLRERLVKPGRLFTAATAAAS